MPDMTPHKTAIAEQPPEIRVKNFKEVTQGYTEEDALKEAGRCLNCKNPPCVKGCPVQVNIPVFIKQVIDNDIAGADKTIRKTNALPAVCGRVCPQENQCEKLCVRAKKGESVGIGRLERFVADSTMEAKRPETALPEDAKKVAVVGSGPAGLTCAGELAQRGYRVTVFEAFHKAGGVLVYGIPEFRLPKDIVAREIDGLRDMGVEIKTNVVIGRSYTLDELFDEGYSAVFLGTGAGLPAFMNIPGENLVGVYSANEYLTRVNLMRAYDPKSDTPVLKIKSAAVVGGGNVAMDSARCALRMGAETVSIVYRRGEDEMPARAEEIHHAKQEGIAFHLLTNPVEIIGDERGRVSGITCVKMELGEPDASGRRSPVQIEGSEFTLDVDCVIMAVGTSPNPLILQTTPDLETNSRGCIVVRDEGTGETSKRGVYAGGDAVTGAATVILAMGAGRGAAKAIDEYLAGR